MKHSEKGCSPFAWSLSMKIKIIEVHDRESFDVAMLDASGK
jgi:hypothetical protein